MSVGRGICPFKKVRKGLPGGIVTLGIEHNEHLTFVSLILSLILKKGKGYLFQISFNIFTRREQEGSNLFMGNRLIYRSKTFRGCIRVNLLLL